MARIAGVDIPRNKQIWVALQYIYGIGPNLSQRILDQAEVNSEVKTDDLNEGEVNRLRDIIDREYQVEGELRKDGVRVEVDARSDRVNLKIRQALLGKVPYILVVGDKEVADSTVSVRLRSGEQLYSQSVGRLTEAVRMAIVDKVVDLSYNLSGSRFD